MNALAFASYGNAQRLLKPYLPDSPVPDSTLRPPTANVDALLSQLRSISPGITHEQLSWRSSYSTVSNEHSLSRVSLAGCWSGLVSTIVTTPIELLKCRLQAADNTTRGLVDCAVQSVKAHGVVEGLFRGFWATLLRDTPAMGVYFGVYEGLKRLGRTSSYVPNVSVVDQPVASSRVEIPLRVHWEHRYEYSTPLLLSAGAIAGMLSWVVTYPIDTVKSVQQTRSRAGVDPKTLRLLPLAREIVQTKGVRGLLGGLTVTCVRALPTNAVTFYTYETALGWLQRMEQGRGRGKGL
jgi:solute carrier family 25 carnitine/acylcarnitine transporter 20/29